MNAKFTILTKRGPALSNETNLAKAKIQEFFKKCREEGMTIVILRNPTTGKEVVVDLNDVDPDQINRQLRKVEKLPTVQ